MRRDEVKQNIAACDVNKETEKRLEGSGGLGEEKVKHRIAGYSVI